MEIEQHLAQQPSIPLDTRQNTLLNIFALEKNMYIKRPCIAGHSIVPDKGDRY